MQKRGEEAKSVHLHPSHPIFHAKLTIGQRASDFLTTFGGSWRFLILLGVYMVVWVGLNTYLLFFLEPFDPFPFILLNLTLSCLAAVQAPIILMSQNRQAERDRINAKYDYVVNRKAEREIENLQKDMEELKGMIRKLSERR